MCHLISIIEYHRCTDNVTAGFFHGFDDNVFVPATGRVANKKFAAFVSPNDDTHMDGSIVQLLGGKNVGHGVDNLFVIARKESRNDLGKEFRIDIPAGAAVSKDSLPGRRSRKGTLDGLTHILCQYIGSSGKCAADSCPLRMSVRS